MDEVSKILTLLRKKIKVPTQNTQQKFPLTSETPLESPFRKIINRGLVDIK
jgi:hypothetical protein